MRLYPAYFYAKLGEDHIIASTRINGSWIFIEPMSDRIIHPRILNQQYQGYKIGRSVTHLNCSYGSDVVNIIEEGDGEDAL